MWRGVTRGRVRAAIVAACLTIGLQPAFAGRANDTVVVAIEGEGTIVEATL